MFAGDARQRFHVTENVATGEVAGWRGFFGGRLNDLDNAAIDDEKGVAGIAGRINRLALAEMPNTGEFADSLQLQKLETGAIGEEVLVEHGTCKAEVVQ